jgi:hypothetical protein
MNFIALTICSFHPLCGTTTGLYSLYIHSIAMCRMRQFLAVLRNFFHSSLLHTFSRHSTPPTILPFSLTSSCHLFFGLRFGLVFYIYFLNSGFFKNCKKAFVSNTILLNASSMDRTRPLNRSPTHKPNHTHTHTHAHTSSW